MEENFESKLWENTYMASRDTLKYLDEQQAALNSALKEVGLAQ
jgi:hypothetical protein